MSADTQLKTTQGSVKTNYMSMTKTKLITDIITHIILIFFGFLTIIPFYWMISTAFKSYGEIFVIPPVWIPKELIWQNFVDSWKAMPFGAAYINSAKITVFVVFFSLFTASMAAFAFAKIEFPGREVIFMGFLATMMVPGQVTMIPNFFVMQYIGWLDTHWALTIPGAISAPFGVFMLRQFIKGIPTEMEEAAIIDGCNYWQIFTKMIIPLIKPPLAALGIFTFMGNWNSFLYPMIYLSTPSKFTVPLLLNLFRGQYTIDWTKMMAGACIALVPVLIVYVIGQKHIIEGITLTGLKA